MHPDTLLELARATHRERLEAARVLSRGRRAGRRRWLRNPVPSPVGGGPS